MSPIGTDPKRALNSRSAACHLGFGEDELARVDIVFAPGEPPHGSMAGPSPDLVVDKHTFGRDRIRRCFGREWEPF